MLDPEKWLYEVEMRATDSHQYPANNATIEDGRLVIVDNSGTVAILARDEWVSVIRMRNPFSFSHPVVACPEADPLWVGRSAGNPGSAWGNAAGPGK